MNQIDSMLMFFLYLRIMFLNNCYIYCKTCNIINQQNTFKMKKLSFLFIALGLTSFVALQSCKTSTQSAPAEEVTEEVVEEVVEEAPVDSLAADTVAAEEVVEAAH